jgi:tetratricopeptide (TPR) repeat protein
MRARTAFVALSASDPGDRESGALLRRTDEAIARRADELLREARRRLDAQSTDEARRLLARVRALEPRAAGLAELESALDRVPLPSVATPRPAPAPAPPAQPREAGQMVKRGAAAMAAGRADDAIRYWELALSLDPGERNASRYLNREYLARGMDAYAAGRLDDAVSFWEKARRADPGDPRAAGFLARARERNERTRELFGTRP